MTFLTLSQTGLILIILSVLILFIFLISFILIFTIFVSKNHVLICQTLSQDLVQIESGFHFFNPFKLRKIKTILLKESNIQGKLGQYDFIISYKITNVYQNAKHEDTFTQKLSYINQTEIIQSPEYAIETIKKIATDYGVDLLEISYKNI